MTRRVFQALVVSYIARISAANKTNSKRLTSKFTVPTGG